MSERVILNDISTGSLDAAEAAIGDGPVTMVNLLWFHDRPAYQAGFHDAQKDSQSAYNRYAAEFMALVKAEGVEGVEVAFHATRLAGLVASDMDDWDHIAIVRYRNFADFRRLVEHKHYEELAKPHRLAAVKNWRLIVTRQG